VLENDLLYSYKAKTKNIKLPDLKVNSGDIVFLEAKDLVFSNVFISVLFNQIELEEGKMFFSGSKLSVNNSKKISYISSAFYFPSVNSIDTLLKITAIKKDLKLSLIYNNFYKILKNINIEYVKDMQINDINFNTRKKIITALSLACPMLMIVLNEPFIDLDNETKAYFYKEINNLANEGSSILVLASQEEEEEENTLTYKYSYKGF